MGLRFWFGAGLVVGAATSVSGCFQATFQTAPAPGRGVVHSQYKSFYLLGLVGANEVDVRSHCRSGRAQQVRIAANAGTIVLSIATLGIYTPRMVYFTCVEERAR